MNQKKAVNRDVSGKIVSLLNSGMLNIMMEKLKTYIVLIFLVVLLLPLASPAASYVFQKNTNPDLKISCFDIDNDLCNDEVVCYLTMHYPGKYGQANIYSNASMTQSADLNYFNHTLQNLNVSGEYPVTVRCVGNTTGFSTFSIEVNPTGISQSSLLNNPVILIIGIFALVLVVMGAYFSSPGLGFLGSIMFVICGVYTMIYGFNNVTDLYTRGVAITFIGLGFVFMFLSAYEWIWRGRE